MYLLTGVHYGGHDLPVDKEHGESERLQGKADDGQDPVEEWDENHAFLMVKETAEKTVDTQLVEASEQFLVAAHHSPGFFFFFSIQFSLNI